MERFTGISFRCGNCRILFYYHWSMWCLCCRWFLYFSTVYYSWATSGELSYCMGCRRGERRLGYHFSVLLLFLFSCGLANHVSAAVFLGVRAPSEVGWGPSEVSCPHSEVFVVNFWSDDSIIIGLLDRVTRWWLRGVTQNARSCIGFVEVWAGGGVSSWNVYVVLLNIFVTVWSACVCWYGWFFSYCYCNTLTASMGCFATLVTASIGVSMGTQLCCG